MDSVTGVKRSYIMSRIRGKNTTPELVVRSFLFRQGFRFRLHVKTLPGHPDIVLPKYRTVIEVRGCFWHQHPGCKTATTPKSNIDFWQRKFHRNVERDRENETALAALGWKVIVVWECETRKKAFPPEVLENFVKSHKNKADG